MFAASISGDAIWWMLTTQRQVWCLLQVKLCDPCLIALKWFVYHARCYTSALLYNARQQLAISCEHWFASYLSVDRCHGWSEDKCRPCTSLPRTPCPSFQPPAHHSDSEHINGFLFVTGSERKMVQLKKEADSYEQQSQQQLLDYTVVKSKEFSFKVHNSSHQNESWKVFRIGTVHYHWPMSAHASQAFSIASCTDSEDLPESWLFYQNRSGFVLMCHAKLNSIMCSAKTQILKMCSEKGHWNDRWYVNVHTESSRR